MRAKPLLLAWALALSLYGVAHAGVIADRTTLNTLLGGSAISEDFAGLDTSSPGTQLHFDGVLNSTLNVPTLGTGTVVSGVDFSRLGIKNFEFDLYSPQFGYYGFQNPALLAGSSALEIDFSGGATKAFGLDLFAYDFFPDLVSIDVYAANDTTLLATLGVFSISSAVVPVFVGYDRAAGGIGRLVLNSNSRTFSPIMDNLTFGKLHGSVPEPATLALLGLGLLGFGFACRRKKM